MKRAAKKSVKSARSPAKRAARRPKAKPVRRPKAARKPAVAKRATAKRAAPKRTRKAVSPGGGAPKKAAAKAAPKAAKKKSSPRPARERRAPRVTRRGLRAYAPPEPRIDGLGADSGGQSGDIEGLRRSAGADSQSVLELLEEGQSFEAGIISGVENAGNADEGEVTTREVPEDDVPLEYLDQ